MLYSLDQVALYLNRATAVIRKAGGDLEYITGKRGISISMADGNGEETQCLSFGSAIWIANNDDQDTLMQQELLNKLGISTLAQLIDHVDRYQGRVLKRDKNTNAFVENAMAPEEKLLYALASRHDDELPKEEHFAAPGPMELPASVKNPSYKLNAQGPAPSSGIVFVTGSYTGQGAVADKQHAEQKLLAALSKSYGSVNGTVTISGCKMACSVCEKVLQDAAEELKKRNVLLKYVNSYVNGVRDQVGLRKKNAVGIKALDVGHYFPAVAQ